VVLPEAGHQEMGENERQDLGNAEIQGKEKAKRVQIPVPGQQHGRKGILQSREAESEIKRPPERMPSPAVIISYFS
jgi:hypothetical protein